MTHKLLLLLCCVLIGVATAAAQEQTAAPPDTTAMTAPEAPRPVTNLKAFDTENDHGHAITLTWDLSPDDGGGNNSVFMYQINWWRPNLVHQINDMRDSLTRIDNAIAEFNAYLPTAERRLSKFESGDVPAEYDQALVRDSLRILADTIAVMKERLPELKDAIRPTTSAMHDMIGGLAEARLSYPNDGFWDSAGVAPAGTDMYKHTGSKDRLSKDFIPDNANLYYRVDALSKDTTASGERLMAESEIVGPVQATGQWFNTGRVPVLFAVLIFGGLVVWFVAKARRGADLYVRPLAGIEAVDDAIGRATEMGRPILYVLGLGTAADVATIASFTILSRVAKRVAEYQTSLNVPTYDPIVMTVAQEVVKSAYLDAGRPDDYREDIVHFVTQSQFAYVAAVNGIMLRERPATNVYMGKFFAESLILAETGALAGSIQISGTDEIAQIPFFIVACDYTLIGEELYAASAYLGREPVLLGSLKAQDYLKAAVIVLATLGLIANNLHWDWFVDLFKVTN